MNKKYNLNLILLTFIIFFIINSSLHAASQNGGIAGSILSWGAGARAIGLGRTYVSISDDANTTYWNPAGMSNIERTSVSTMFSQLIGESQYSYLSLVWPTIGNDTWGGYYTSLTSGDFIKADSSGLKNGSFEIGTTAMALAYAKKINKEFSIGSSCTYISNTVDNISDSTILGDLSTYYKAEKFNFGAVAKNILAYKLDSDSKDTYPLTLRFGGSTKVFEDKMLLSMDITRIESGSGFEWGMGSEYELFKSTKIRGGFNSNDLYIGSGLIIKNLETDLAIHFSELEEMSYFFSVNYKWGTQKTLKKEYIISSNVYEIKKHIKNGEYEKAFQKSKQTLGIDSTNSYAQSKYQKLKIIHNIYFKNKEKTNDTKIKKLIRLAKKDFIENNNITAINKLKYSLFLQPKNNNNTKKLLGYLLNTTEINDLKGEDIIGKKSQESLVNFYSSNFTKVIENCNEIIELDPENTDAYLRKGSALFMLVEEDKAINAWKKVLELDPSKKDEIEKIIRKLKETRNSENNNPNKNEVQKAKSISLGMFKTKRQVKTHSNKIKKLGINTQIENNSPNSYRLKINGENKTQSEMNNYYNKIKQAGYKAFWMK